MRGIFLILLVGVFLSELRGDDEWLTFENCEFVADDSPGAVHAPVRTQRANRPGTEGGNLERDAAATLTNF